MEQEEEVPNTSPCAATLEKQGVLLCGTFSCSTNLSWCRQWFQSHPHSAAVESPDTPAFLQLIEEFSPHWGGTCMVGVRINTRPFSRPWIRHAGTSQQTRVRPGFVMPEGSFQDVWQMRTFVLTWMRECGQVCATELTDFRIVAFLSKEVVLWFTVYVISQIYSAIPLISAVLISMSACSTVMKHATRTLMLYEQPDSETAFWTLACLIFV